MDSYLTEEALWAGGLASRLKLLQANFAEDAPAARQTYITEEIDRALKNVVPARRKLYLEALAEQFPAWQSEQTVPVAPTPLGAVPETPSELLARFIEVVSALPHETKAEFVAKLKEAGLVPKESGPATIELTEEGRKKLGLAPGAQLHVERGIKWLVIESEAVLALDQLSWTLWKELASRSAIRKDSDLLKLSGQYLAGDNEVSTEQLRQSLEKTRRLIAGLMGAVGRAGSHYGKKLEACLSPEAIEDVARLEKPGPFVSLEVVAWRVFKRLAVEHLSEPAIESGIREAIVKVAEDLMTGRPGR